MPTAERATIPAEYGVRDSGELVAWQHVEERLATERVYWVTSVGRNGRPHVRPIDGLYLDGAIYIGGSPKTRWVKAVRSNPHVTVNLGSISDVVIFEGDAEVMSEVPRELAERLAAESKAKFPEYGMTADNYGEGVIAIRPRKVLAWTDFATNPTRFTFD
jgi:general stress protein 26